MSTPHARNGSAAESQTPQEITSRAPVRRPTAGLGQDPGVLIAQIPDLDHNATLKVAEKPADGRIISQALSVKLVFGVGIALLIGAFLPYLFGKASRPNPPVRELPAWSGNAGSPAAIPNTAQTMAPTWPSATMPPMSGAIPPQTASAPAPNILLPQPPQFGDTRPAALTDPSWLQSRAAAAVATAVPPLPALNRFVNPPVANANPPDNRGDYHGFDRDPRPASGYSGNPATDGRNVQADNRNDPAAPYRNGGAQYNYRGNPIEAAPGSRDVPPSGYPRDTRYDNSNGAYPPATGQGSPLMPSGGPGPTSTYRDPQISEPGVARFEGTIATPPVR